MKLWNECNHVYVKCVADKARNLRHIPVEFHQKFLHGNGTKDLKNLGDGGMWNDKVTGIFRKNGCFDQNPSQESFTKAIVEVEKEFQLAWEKYKRIRK